MTVSEVIPIITSLSHTDKFKLMQVILTQLAAEDGIPLQAEPDNQQEVL